MRMKMYRVTWEVYGKLCQHTSSSRIEIQEARKFMLHNSLLKRDNISNIIEVTMEDVA